MKSRPLHSLRHLIGLFVSVALLDACTFVSIEGDHNAVSDTGGHGGGVALPSRAESSNALPRLMPRRSPQ